jgi:hypothetical protein
LIEYLASPTTDLPSAWGTAGGAIVTAISVVVASVVGIRTLRAFERDSRDRSRPMVGAQLVRDPHPSERGAAYLLVRNYGQSVAYDVQVTFDPPMENVETRSGDDSYVPFMLSRYENPIANLMPGVDLRNLWFVPSGDADDQGDLLNDEPIPNVVTVTVRYSDTPNFWERAAHRYVDTFVLDMALLRGEVVVRHSDDHLGLHKRTTKALEQIAPAVQSTAKAIGKIEDYAKPEEVRVRERAERERRRAVVESRRQERQRRNNPTPEPANE